MICPHCKQEVPEGPECAVCGIVIAKFRVRQDQAVMMPQPSDVPSAEVKQSDSSGPSASAPGPKRRQILYRQLARMLDSGLSVEESLELMARHSSAHLSERLRAVVARLRSGDSLAAAFRVAGGLLDESGLALIKAGEATGAVPASLEALASSAELELELRRQLVRALIYPFVLFTLVFFLPKAYLVISEGWGAYLEACLLPYVLSLGVLAALFLGLPRFLVLVMGRDRYHGILKRIPGIGGVLKKAAAVRFCRHLASGLRAGLDLKASLRLSAQAAQDPAWSRAVTQVDGKLAEGATLHESLAETGLMDEDLGLVLAAGERSGRLAESLAQHARTQQVALQHKLQVNVMLLAIAVLLLTYLFVVMSIKSEYEMIFGGLQDQLNGVLDGDFEGLLNGKGGGNMEQLMKELKGSIPPELQDALK